jgi:hypothetical protein
MQEINESTWSVSLYEKVGRSYFEMGVFWEDTATFEEATEVFAEVCTPLPPAVAIAEASNKEYTEPVEFEIRLYREKRIVGTFLWTSDVITMCIEDFKSFKTKKFLIKAEVVVPEDTPDDHNEWDIDEVLSVADIVVIDSSPINVIK